LPRRAAVASFTGPITTGSLLSIGLAPSYAMASSYLAMADSIALAMANAVANQQRAQVITDVALTQVLAMIIAKGGAAP